MVLLMYCTAGTAKQVYYGDDSSNSSFLDATQLKQKLAPAETPCGGVCDKLIMEEKAPNHWISVPSNFGEKKRNKILVQATS